jgi:hypothetical protein
VFERAQVKMLPVLNRTADHAPIVPACCNVCRTCTTTNLVGLAFGAVAAAGYGLARAVRRFASAS